MNNCHNEVLLIINPICSLHNLNIFQYFHNSKRVVDWLYMLIIMGRFSISMVINIPK